MARRARRSKLTGDMHCAFQVTYTIINNHKRNYHSILHLFHLASLQAHLLIEEASLLCKVDFSTSLLEQGTEARRTRSDPGATAVTALSSLLPPVTAPRSQAALFPLVCPPEDHTQEQTRSQPARMPGWAAAS